jgi:hypothetical protein
LQIGLYSLNYNHSTFLKMNLKDESLYYLKRIFKHKDIKSKRDKVWCNQLYKHQCIFIHIPKTAGISVSVSLLGKSIGNMSALYYQALFGKEDFNNYFKFAFVRNPFTRLVSAYEFLKQGGGGPLDAKNVQIVQPYDTLEDFVINYLTPTTAKANRYFRPQYQFICDSDNRMLIDYIGRFESIEDDYEYIRKKIGSGEPLKKLNITPTSKRSVKEHYLNNVVLQKVIAIYKKDFEFFGYSKDVSDVV